MKIRNILLSCSLALCGSIGVVSAVAINTPRPVVVKADIPSGLYNSAEAAVASNDMPALYEALKTASNTGYVSGSYKTLWDWYKKTDIRSDGKIKDWYSDDTNFTPGSTQCGNYSKIGDCYNREHSIPKSWWGGSESNQGCDIYIVVPTDGKINNTRGNVPFGIVDPSVPQYASEVGKNKFGSAKSGSGISGTVFEPFDSVKGDFARVYFYAVCKWSRVSMTTGEGSECFQSGTYSSSNNYGLTNYAKNLFYSWHKLDPVDDFEINRNNYGQSTQGNRNPFVDHPEYADYLWGGVTPETQDVQTLTVSPKSVSLIYGGAQQLTPTITPSNASKSVSYTSSNTSVATVSETGLITAGNTAGSATITVRSNKTTDKYDTCTVNVTAPTPVAVTGVTAEDILVTEGGSLQINASYTPSNAYPVPTISYTSNDTSVATVSNTGLVTGVSVGDTTISIVASQSTGASVSKVIDVTVEESKGWAQANSISAGDQVVFGNKSSGSVAGAFDGSFLDSVSGSVWQDSLITSLAADATIWTVGGTSGAYTFTNQSGEVLHGNGKSLSLDSGNSTWSVSFSSGSATMTAGSDGKPLCYNTGSPRYKTYDASSSSFPLVEIYKGGSAPVSDYVTIDKSSMSLTTGDTGTISVTSSSGTVTWSSSNTAVATVANGTVKAVSAGSATITATCGTATATCAVSVSAPVVPSVSLNKGSLSLTVGGSETLVATTTGSGTLIWSSSNTSVATVSSGKVTAVASGSATITAFYGGATATCSVTVSQRTFTNSIQECYSKTDGTKCTNVYGLYVGSVNNGQSSMIMNGEYGIMLYYTSPNSSWVENQTYLKVTTSTLAIYKNLYELKSCTVETVSSQSVIDNNIAPVVTYTITGNESTSDLTIANRLSTLTGTIVSGSVIKGSDSTIKMNVNGHQIDVFIKKNDATADVKTAFDNATTAGTSLTVQGFTSFFTNFQVSFKKVIEEEASYLAADFAQDLLDLTDTACTYSEEHGWSDVKSTLSPIWLTLEGSDYYAKLPAAQKEILASTVASKTGTTIQIAMDRYDHIVARYGLGNFITGRTVVSLRNFRLTENKEDLLSIVIIVGLISLSTVDGYFFIKKRKENI